MVISTPLTSWLRMVASAAPATPISRPTTNSTSSRILTMHATIRKYRGRRLSPTALSTPVPMLYTSEGTMPQK